MAENEKKLNISISVDGTDTVVGKLGDATDALNAMAEAVGSGGLAGEMQGLNSEMAQTLGVLGSATAATRQAAQASEAAAAATKKETEAQQALNEAKSAGGSGPEGGAPGLDELPSLPPPPTEWEEAMKKLARNAEEATKAIKESAEELEKVAEAVEKIGEKSDDSGEKLDKSIGGKRAEMAGQIAGILGQVGGVVRTFSNDLKGLDDKSAQTWGNVADGVDMASGALSGAAQGFSVGGPFGAAVGGLVGLMSGPLKNAFNGMSSDLQAAKDSLKNAEEWEKKLKNAIRERADEVRNAKTNEYYQRELTSLKGQTREIERQRNVRDAEKSARQAINETEDERAIRAGASPVAVKSARVSSNMTEKINEVHEGINTAKAAAAAAEEAVGVVEKKVEEVKKNTGDLSAETKDAESLLKQKQAEKEQLDLAADKLTDTLNIRISEIVANGQNALGDIAQQASEGQTDSAKKAKEAYEKLTADGTVVSVNSQSAYATLTTMLYDAVPDAEQTKEIARAVQGLSDGITSNNQVLKQALLKAQADQAAFATELADVKKRLSYTGM